MEAVLHRLWRQGTSRNPRFCLPIAVAGKNRTRIGRRTIIDIFSWLCSIGLGRWDRACELPVAFIVCIIDRLVTRSVFSRLQRLKKELKHSISITVWQSDKNRKITQPDFRFSCITLTYVSIWAAYTLHSIGYFSLITCYFSKVCCFSVWAIARGYKYKLSYFCGVIQ